MPYVMQYETWMNLTDINFRPRSKQLRCVDKALKTYHEFKTIDNFMKIRYALHQWKMFKGFDGEASMPAWRVNDRNRKKAVENLDAQLFGMLNLQSASTLNQLANVPYYGIESLADAESKRLFKEMRENAMVKLFHGKKMVIRETSLALAVYFLRSKINKAKAEASATAAAAAAQATAPAKAAARQAVEEMIERILGGFPLEVITETMKMLTEMIPGFLTEIASATTQYLSVVVSGAKALKNAGQAIKEEYSHFATKQHLSGFAAGDPYEAVQAVRRLIDRDRNQHARLAAIYGVDTTVKAAATIADAAAYGAPTVSAIVTPLQGFATAMASLGLQIFLIARDFYEKYQANKILADSDQLKISGKLFEASPLTGCYFVACTNTSDVINFLVDDIGAPGWRLDVEVMVSKHVHPMQKFAREYICDARFEIQGDGLQFSKGTIDENEMTRKHKFYWAKLARKLRARTPFLDKPENYITKEDQVAHRPPRMLAVR